MIGPRYPDGTAYIGGDQLDAAHTRFRLREPLPFTPPRIEPTMVTTDPYATATMSMAKLDRALLLVRSIEALTETPEEELIAAEKGGISCPRYIGRKIAELARMVREVLE